MLNRTVEKLTFRLEGVTGLPPDIIAKLMRFAFVGGVSTISYFVMVLAAIEWLAWEPVMASVLSYCAAMFVSYFGQSLVTFRISPRATNRASRFIIVSLVGISVSWSAMAILTDKFDIHYLASALVVCVAVPVLSFIAMNFWVFIHNEISD